MILEEVIICAGDTLVGIWLERYAIGFGPLGAGSCFQKVILRTFETDILIRLELDTRDQTLGFAFSCVGVKAVHTCFAEIFVGFEVLAIGLALHLADPVFGEIMDVAELTLVLIGHECLTESDGVLDAEVVCTKMRTDFTALAGVRLHLKFVAQCVGSLCADIGFRV